MGVFFSCGFLRVIYIFNPLICWWLSGLFYLLVTVNNTDKNIHIQVLESLLSIFLVIQYTPKGNCSLWYFCLFFVLRKHQTVLHNLYHFTFLLAVHKCSSLPNSLLSGFVFLVTILTGMKWCLTMVLILTSLITRDGEHHFMCLLAICISSLEKCLFRSFVHFWIVLFPYFLSCSSLYILTIDSS